MKGWRFLLVALAWLPQAALADNSPPITYSRTPIVITRQANEVLAPRLPWLARKTRDEGVAFDTEVRDARAFYRQEGWISLSSPAPQTALMLAFNTPTIAPIARAEDYSALDILLIDQQGTIRQIYPNLVLATLDHDLTPEMPVMAFLLLKGGTCESQLIRPGDSVEYKIFKKPPSVLSAGSPASTAASSPATFTPPSQMERPAMEPKIF